MHIMIPILAVISIALSIWFGNWPKILGLIAALILLIVLIVFSYIIFTDNLLQIIGIFALTSLIPFIIRRELLVNKKPSK